jgi:hypothetical protein
MSQKWMYVFLPLKITLKFRPFLTFTRAMGEGWCYDLKYTHFDQFSAPDFNAITRVYVNLKSSNALYGPYFDWFI